MSVKEINKAIFGRQCLWMAGLFGTLAANAIYPLFDRNNILWIALVFFSTPLIFHVIIGLTKRRASSLNRLKATYLYSAFGLLTLTLIVALNGAADTAPVHVVHSSIVRKTISRGRHSTTRHLVVRSWRSKRNTEDLEVPATTYSNAFVGQTLSIEVHAGSFGLPWYGRVVLER